MSDRQTFRLPSLTERHPKDKQQIELTLVFNVFFNQADASPLIDALQHYSSYDPYLLDRIQFVIVDDCSPVEMVIDDFGLNLSVYRIETDIPWNQGGARNLGVTFAKSDKVIVSDIDLLFPEHTLQHLLDRKNPGKHMFKFWRAGEDGRYIRPHANVFFFSRSRFLKYFGYDEEFSGGYGAEDYRFVKYQKAQGTIFRKLSKKYSISNRSSIDRSQSYHSLQRSFDRNTPVDNRKRNELIAFGGLAGHSRIFLNFRFSCVLDFNRPKPKSETNFFWKRRWILRQISSFFCSNN
jgi:hypothetical protein